MLRSGFSSMSEVWHIHEIDLSQDMVPKVSGIKVTGVLLLSAKVWINPEFMASMLFRENKSNVAESTGL